MKMISGACFTDFHLWDDELVVLSCSLNLRTTTAFSLFGTVSPYFCLVNFIQVMLLSCLCCVS